jgi:hypothetical protein
MRRTTLLFIIVASTACGGLPPLAVEADTASLTVHDDAAFDVHATIRNLSNDEQILQTNACDYGNWNWRTDNPLVSVVAPGKAACKKNALVYLQLKPGETYARVLSVRLSNASRRAVDRSATFRVGFEPRLGYGLLIKHSAYIWSKPITVRRIN